MDYGLISADYKHKKSIENEEIEEDKRKPFKKFFGQPTFIVIFISIFLPATISIIYFSYKDQVLNVQDTKHEMAQILTRIHSYKSKNLQILSIDNLINGRPLLKTWKTDSWGTAYRLVRSNGFAVHSADRYRKFGTSDNLFSK
ncbi:hypothetical protein [Dokdonia sp. Dokd-P16]|uniref:hypothetical protein n=1 Tax=Dokdonia sp. Dokd-P16 TaxID=2173169 RepID=UPI0013A5997A|nr:hypothetical protein [Dokdonia sp. Dokd-P16]